MRTQTEGGNVFAPGDIVRLSERWLKKCGVDRYYLNGFSSYNLRPGVAYRVRSVFIDSTSGGQMVRLLGIIGGRGENGEEIGIPGETFEWIRSTPHLQDSEEVCENFTVCVPLWVAREIEGMPVRGIIEGFCIIGESGIEAACRRWSIAWKMSESIQAMAERLSKDMLRENGCEVTVAVSPMAAADVEEVCERLQIDPIEWRRGVIGNVARRCELLRLAHERHVRNKHKSRR